ncbi:hypothetical protein U8527_00630 [Kordia algicida OT-1]|uniref:Uncharacterized protein n=1 Tax=Kordia algicida OT-1 TaxID=391587 RepID=A9DRH9_9FLAO|nr:hypothetical protein [Kordia algicida]EDP96796.1 hypothetical protein KAOT1_16573 [Kordia algicida OT-1]
MKKIQLSTDRILLVLITVLVWYSTLMKACESDTEIQPQPTVTVVKDTIWQTKIDTLRIETTKFQQVYIPITGTQTQRKNFKEKISVEETKQFTEGKLYKDTLQTDDIDIYTYNLVDGTLIDSKFSYQLKVPREVTITKTIEHPKTYKSGLYIFSEIGGNKQQFDNLSLGLQYQHKGKWFASYRINLNQINTTTHNVGVGVRLW